MLVSKGYPENYETGKMIKGLGDVSESIVFHAGTKMQEGNILSNGGRVLSVTSYGNNIEEALKKSYESIDKIIYENKYYRRDIGYEFNPFPLNEAG